MLSVVRLLWGWVWFVWRSIGAARGDRSVMATRKKSPEQLAAKNMKIFLKHGPGLRKDYSTWIVQREPENGRILIGGLFGMGVRPKWCNEEERHEGHTG